MNYYQYDPDLPLPYKWDCPAGVPSDYDELARDYYQYILKILNRHNKVERNTMDLYQGIWEKFLNTGFLEKFRDGLARRLPLTMTGDEVVAFLGIAWGQWIWFLRNHEHAQFIDPLEGDREALHATWETYVICEIDYQEAFKGKAKKNKRHRPPVSSRGFKAYLQVSVANTFKNQCRSKSRRDREQVLPPNTVITRHDGNYHQSSRTMNLPSWEANIAAAMVDEESMIDFRDRLRGKFGAAKIDFDTPEGARVIDILIDQGLDTGSPRRNMELLDLLGEGYTLAEASMRVQSKSSRLKAKMLAR